MVDAIIFIDAQQYLDLYRLQQGKPLLELLVEQRDYIFVTDQIVDEVHRRKLEATLSVLKNKFDVVSLGDHLTIPKKTLFKLQEKAKEINELIKKLNKDWQKVADQTLNRISRSEDDVSRSLNVLFERAVAHTPSELRKAKERQSRGNPPGKGKGSPLGDELNWEQLLAQCKDKSSIWIITRDLDYCVKHLNKLYLNPLLYRDLVQINRGTPDVFWFENALTGMEAFVNATGVEAKMLPTEKESKEIKDELDKLPDLSWMTVSSGHPGYEVTATEPISVIMSIEPKDYARSITPILGGRRFCNKCGSVFAGTACPQCNAS